MKITVFTSNQPRHLSLIKDLSTIADEVHAIIEVNTIFPGRKADFFKKSEVMQSYFKNVIDAERKFFGDISFLPSNVTPLILKSGDLIDVNMEVMKPAMDADKYVVFGSSFIKGDLIEHLVNKGAYNIHMGVSPYYRGSSCNFWAAYDGHPEFVGATIHMLSKGLDSGDMLFHALPSFEQNPFDLGMKAVKSAHTGLIEYISSGAIEDFSQIKQDRSQEMRYTKNSEFTDSVAKEYLDRYEKMDIADALSKRDDSKFLNPIIY